MNVFARAPVRAPPSREVQTPIYARILRRIRQRVRFSRPTIKRRNAPSWCRFPFVIRQLPWLRRGSPVPNVKLLFALSFSVRERLRTVNQPPGSIALSLLETTRPIALRASTSANFRSLRSLPSFPSLPMDRPLLLFSVVIMRPIDASNAFAATICFSMSSYSSKSLVFRHHHHHHWRRRRRWDARPRVRLFFYVAAVSHDDAVFSLSHS